MQSQNPKLTYSGPLHTGPESIFLVQKLYLAIRCYGISSILDIDRIYAILTILMDKK